MPAPQFPLRTIGTLPPNADTDPSSYLIVPATIRDFTHKPLSLFPDIQPHPDFEMDERTQGGYRLVPNIVVKNKLEIDPKDNKPKPIYAGGTVPWTTGVDNFNKWFRGRDPRTTEDVLLIMTRTPAGTYVLDSDEDATLKAIGGFFPIDGKLLGNSGKDARGKEHNFHFTLEAHCQFTYKRGQIFRFRGDDDLWVFIGKPGATDTKLVIDLGGVHPREKQEVNLDTLGLTEGETYSLDLFYAERHTTEANFRVETSILVLPTVSIEATKPLAHKTNSVRGEFTLSMNRPAPAGGMVVKCGINELGDNRNSPPLTHAGAGVDFFLDPGILEVPIPEGQMQAKLQVVPLGAPPAGKFAGAVVLSLKPDRKYQVGKPADTVTIFDQVPWHVTIVPVADARKVNPQQNGAFKVQLNHPAPVTGLAVNYRVFPGSAAIEGHDYVALSGVVVVSPGQTEAIIPVAPLGSLNETVAKPLALQLGLGTDYMVDATPATIHIHDQAIAPPPIPTVGITGTGPAIRNPRQNGFFTIICPDKPAHVELKVSYQLSGTAVMGRDYVDIAEVLPGTPFGTATIPSGQNSVRIPVIPTLLFGSPTPVRVTATLLPAPGTYNLGANPAHVDIIAKPTPQGPHQ
jgi:fibro-slime domain-containing protein